MGRTKPGSKPKKEEVVADQPELETEEPETDDDAGAETETDTDVEADVEPEVEEAVPEKPAAPVKRTPGVKEVIPFRWKLIGEAGGLVLTLFKSVEREDVDAQFARIESEGYYRNLKILDANAPISQTTAVAARVPVHKIPTEVPRKEKAKRASTKKDARPTSIRVRATRPTPPKPKTRGKAKAKSASPARPAKKKAVAPVKARKKRTAKKK